MQKLGKQKIIVLVVIGVLLILLCNYYFVFYFYDKGVEQAVREHAVGSTILVGMEEEPYNQFYKRDKPLKGIITRKRILNIDFMALSLKDHDIKSIRDVKKFKNLNYFSIGYGGEGYDNGKKINMPQNMNSLSTLRNLEEVFFSDMNIIASEFEDECKNVNQMILMRCDVDNYAFIERFLNLKKLSMIDMEISSVDFGSQLNSLEYLRLSNNQYQCSLEALVSFKNLRNLSVKSDDPVVFAEIPPLHTVRELTLNGTGAPDKDHVTQYLEWDNLERLDLNDGYYDVVTKTWHEYEKQ